MQANPLTVPLLVAFFVTLGYMFAFMVEFENIVDHLRSQHPDEWDEAGRPPSYFLVPAKSFFRSIAARRRLEKLLLREIPEWASDEAATSKSVQKWRRRYRRMQISAVAYAVLLVAGSFLQPIAVA